MLTIASSDDKSLLHTSSDDLFLLHFKGSCLTHQSVSKLLVPLRLTAFPSQVPSSSGILQGGGGKRISCEASAGDCLQSPVLRRRGLGNKKRRRVILSQESEEEQAQVQRLTIRKVSG